MARILVIDDDPTIRCLIAGLLEARGHSVVTEQDGRAGARAFDLGRMDLVVTDLVMPIQEGIATISAIRRLSPTVPILAITGSHTIGRYGSYLDAAELLGATATLPKPLEPDRLIETVGRLLRPESPA
jgi:CheY-like chemotaxis protein